MKSKLIVLALLPLFLVSLVSATIDFLTVPELSQTGNFVDITIQSTDNETVTFSGLASIPSNGQLITFITPANVLLAAGPPPTTIRINYTIPADFEFELGKTYTASLSATGDSGNSPTVTQALRFEETEFCEIGDVGDLDISIDINNKGSFGKDDEWYLLSEIEVEVEVENNGAEDIDDVAVEWQLINKNTGELISDEEEDEFNIDEDETETMTFTIELDPDDFDDSDLGDTLVLYVKAYSKDEGEDLQCVSASEEAELIKDKFVVIDDIEFNEIAQCGSKVDVALNVWNIGEDDEEDVSVVVTNSELGLDEVIEIGDLDPLDNDKTSFSFDVPTDVAEGAYELKFEVQDEDGDIYENDDDDEAIFSKTIQLKNGCKGSPIAEGAEGESGVRILAVLDSDAVAGEELIVRATIENIGTIEISYQVLVTNYDSWAGLDSVEPRSFSLTPGSSKDVLIKLLPNADVSGEKEFTIQAVYSGKITEQRIIVPAIEPAERAGVTGLAIGENIQENWFIWLIALINIILVILIIIIAVRVARK